jgi:16S rRNA (guanine966-N2)-methyltransferase
MRISGGEARGTKLKVPRGARPASERVRQAIFTSMGESVRGARVLDLYCGSGAYGLEALSRGAASATFVDHDERAVEACRSNAKAAGLEGVSRIRRVPVDRYVRRQAAADGPFDLVFVDPPYDEAGPPDRLIGALEGALAEGGRVVLEARWNPADVPAPSGFLVEADRRYGDTRVLTFRRLGGK